MVDKIYNHKWAPTHKHVKSGANYQVLFRTKDVTGDNWKDVVVYRGLSGYVWVRDAAEFDDGRFKEL
jgi:hypothetical protein